jgi:tetratricopeptide (TPR) repeat protein
MLHKGAIAIALVVGLTTLTAQAEFTGRLVDAVDVSERQGRVDINIIFGCGLRYLTHTPASEGDTLQVRLVPLPDCGDVSTVLLGAPSLLDGGRVIRSLDLERLAGREIIMNIGFAAKEVFVIAPTADSHGLRIRLLRTQSEGAQVYIGESPLPPANYAINLDSAQQPFDEEAIEHARQVTGVAAFVSEYQLGDQKWYRLRVGPIGSEADARRLLLAARTEYPKAWLAIGDEEAPGAVSGADSGAVVLPTLPQANASMTPQDIEATLNKAKKAFSRKDYATAIPLLTKVLEQPEFPRRAEAQELLGLARERSRQLAHAKAEYEEYLRRYPDGPAVKRVKERLRALAWATRPLQAGASGVAEEESAWRVYGGLSQIYRRDTSQVENAALSTDLTTQNAVLNDVDVIARRRGERFDFATRLTAGYVKDMLSDGPGDQTRVSLAYVEFGDREIDWTGRFGRQTRNADGLFGTFDGLYAGYQLKPLVRLNASFGYPVESTRDGVVTGRQFAGLSANFGPFASAWDFSLYTIFQTLEGNTDRRAVGTEVHYFKPGRTLVALVDYDIHFQDLNSALLLGTLELPGRWTLTANLDHRKSPPLTLRNSLIGQPVENFDELMKLFTVDELEQLARDRTADADLYSVSISRPFGERWQWTVDYASFTSNGTPASGGVEAVADPGTESAISLQGIVSSLFGGSDLSTILLRHQSGSTTDTDSLGISTRFRLWGEWRLGPQLRVDRREFALDGSEQMIYAPTLRLDLQTRRVLFELEGGAEFGRRDLAGSIENTTRYYFSLGYRMNF